MYVEADPDNFSCSNNYSNFSSYKQLINSMFSQLKQYGDPQRG